MPRLEPRTRETRADIARPSIFHAVHPLRCGRIRSGQHRCLFPGTKLENLQRLSHVVRLLASPFLHQRRVHKFLVFRLGGPPFRLDHLLVDLDMRDLYGLFLLSLEFRHGLHGFPRSRFLILFVIFRLLFVPSVVDGFSCSSSGCFGSVFLCLSCTPVLANVVVRLFRGFHPHGAPQLRLEPVSSILVKCRTREQAHFAIDGKESEKYQKVVFLTFQKSSDKHIKKLVSCGKIAGAFSAPGRCGACASSTSFASSW